MCTVSKLHKCSGNTINLLDSLPGFFPEISKNQELQSVVDKTILK